MARPIAPMTPSEDPLELAWCAGFFEGEGCVTRDRPTGRRARPTLNLGQSGDPRQIQRFIDGVGTGTLCGPYPPRTNNRQIMWRWGVAGQKAHAVMALLRPYLGEGSFKVEKYDRLVREGWGS